MSHIVFEIFALRPSNLCARTLKCYQTIQPIREALLKITPIARPNAPPTDILRMTSNMESLICGITQPRLKIVSILKMVNMRRGKEPLPVSFRESTLRYGHEAGQNRESWSPNSSPSKELFIWKYQFVCSNATLNRSVWSQRSLDQSSGWPSVQRNFYSLLINLLVNLDRALSLAVKRSSTKFVTRNASRKL